MSCFNYFFDKYLILICVLGIVLDVRNIVINKIDTLLFIEFLFFIGEIDKIRLNE